MDTHDAARHDLDAWQAELAVNPFDADDALRGLLDRHLADDPDRRAALETRAHDFAQDLLEVVGPAARRFEHRAHLPELVRWSSTGRRVERVEFDPAYERAASAVWRSGLIGLSGKPGSAYEQAALLLLLSLEGEAGQACPATCTIGLARALRRDASDEVRERFLPPLLDRDAATAERGSQFLTEVQGGSDVGANATRAHDCGDGTFAITGEKWFCSVADADQFFLTARVDGDRPGTRGLGSFVVPRLVDGEPNGFALRRLKEKLGTRGLASGEIDFDGAIAWPIGPVEHGFRTAVGVVLNTSRWMTALGSTGMMRRAVLEATAYATHRRAFGQPIGEFPAVRHTLAGMRAGWLGSLHLVMELTRLEDLVDAGTAGEVDVLVHRLLVNAAKYSASIRATQVVRDAIEVFGGNGTIEDFSVLPRLYRDAIVYESWEGTHNVLAAQVFNDLRRLPILEALDARLGELDATATVGDDWDRVRTDVSKATEDPDLAATHGRGLLDRLTLVAEIALLHASGESAAAEHLRATKLLAASSSLDDVGLAARVDELVRR